MTWADRTRAEERASRTGAPGQARLRLAIALAHEAGRQARASRGRTRIDWKGPGDRVTDADLAVQSRIVHGIRAAFPGDAIVAEEGHFALGIPCFAVSIGILRHGRPHGGVVHDPCTGFTAWALRDRGAHTGARAMLLRPNPLTAASNMSVRVPLDPTLAPAVTAWLGRYKLRAFGSVALHLAYAALGALDVVLDHKATLWDVAAGAAILLEAGGVMTDLDGRPLFPPGAAAYRGSPVPFLAGNPAAHAAALVDCHAALRARPAATP
jgi:myo-inositol-1(or 4)-monophosphatase